MYEDEDFIDCELCDPIDGDEPYPTRTAAAVAPTAPANAPTAPAPSHG